MIGMVISKQTVSSIKCQWQIIRATGT